jgi:two-component system, sensor histidine kinase and response regulator
VEVVNDGEAALARCATRDFGIILLDLNLPGCDGVDVARQLSQRTPRPRIIGCSAEALPTARDAALAAGMDAFMTKPVDLAALAEVIGRTAPTAAAPTEGALPANLFERLRATDSEPRARRQLGRELPAELGRLRAAQLAGDRAAVGRHAHRLRSTALLANDAAVDQLCLRLERAAAAGCDKEFAGILDELTDRIEATE